MGATTILAGHYNPALVRLSILIAIGALAASLDVAGRIWGAEGGLPVAWILAAGVAMGGGIWAMHFVGILAFSLPVAISYDVPVTLASLALAIFVTSISFIMVFRGAFRIFKVVVGGVFMGLGVAGTVVILTLGLVSAAVDRRFADVRLRESQESRGAMTSVEAALRELKATPQGLIQAEKLATLSRPTAGVAHEFNTQIGTALTVATPLQCRTKEFVASVTAGMVTKTAALGYAGIAGDRIELVYSADGSDIAPSHLVRIFDPFFTTSRAAGGTGLGMHIVCNLVAQTLKGMINVEAPARGACFTLRFPMHIVNIAEAIETL
jgi:signal transduction histidine kinase